eukprot:1651809-Rhodomonas_salina.1
MAQNDFLSKMLPGATGSPLAYNPFLTETQTQSHKQTQLPVRGYHGYPQIIGRNVAFLDGIQHKDAIWKVVAFGTFNALP